VLMCPGYALLNSVTPCVTARGAHSGTSGRWLADWLNLIVLPAGAKPNTVYLRSEDRDRGLGLYGGLGPVPVGGALDSVVAHLALDDARGGA
jgi:hypothetical protein